MTGFVISMVDERGGFKGERTYTLSDDDMARIVWCFNSWFACGGDAEKVFHEIGDRAVASIIDKTMMYEMQQPRDPIVPEVK